MLILPCTRAHAPEILAIFNHAIVTSTALYDYEPRTAESMVAWFDAKERGGFPVIGAFEREGGELLGFASYGTFRAWPAYQFTVEHSVYVREDRRGRGLGRRLLREIVEAARAKGRHVIVGVIDSTNAPSIALHRAEGFEQAGTLREVGWKFGRWLDVEFYQKRLGGPEGLTAEG